MALCSLLLMDRFTVKHSISSIIQLVNRQQRLTIMVICVVVLLYLSSLGSEAPFQYPLEIDMRHLVTVLKSKNFKSRDSIVRYLDSSAVLPINIHHFKYLRNPIKKCISSQFVFLIKTSVKNKIKRNILRNYFAKQGLSRKLQFTFKWVFFVGKSLDSDSEIIEPNDDIIQIDFIDVYLNNTLKLCAEIFWLHDNLCKENLDQRILLLDDDVFINFRNLHHLLHPSFDRQAIFGHLYPESRPYRMSWSKWFISKEDYNSDVYPPYISGSTIVMNRATLVDISLAIPYIRYLPFDDVYVGIIAKKVGIEVINDERILIDYICGLFCRENIDQSIAIHVPDDVEKLEQLTEKYAE